MRQRIFLLFIIVIFIYTSVSMAEKQSHVIPTVTIKAKKKTSSITSGPKTIIGKQQILTAGISTLSEALQNLGGVQIRDTMGNGSQVFLSLRGFGDNASSNTLLLINGIPITNPDTAAPDLNAIPMSEIESIEVISGSESVLYGDQAVGGTINIITNNQLRNNNELSCNGGSYHQRVCYAAFQRHYNQVDVGVTVGKKQTDNYREHNQYDQDIIIGKINYFYQTGNVNFEFDIANENMQYPGALTAIQVAQNRRQASNDTDFFKDWSGFYHLQLQQDLNANWGLHVDLARREMHGDGVLSSPFTQSRTSYLVKPQLNGKVNVVTILTGVDVQADQYELSSSFSTTTDSLQKYGGFFLVNVPYNSKLSFSFGSRGAGQKSVLTILSRNVNINRAIATTLGATYQLAPNAKLYLRRAGNFRFPKADENAAASSDTHGLLTQRGISYETGIEVNHEKYVGKAGIYQLNLKDEITFDPLQTPEFPFGTNKNLPPTVRKGVILSGSYTINPVFMLDAQYNYVNARFSSGINSGNRIPLVSESILHFGVSYRFAQHWNLYSESIFTGNQFAANDDANLHGKTGGYTIFNMNLRYEYLHFSAALHLNNIFNKKFYFYTIYQPGVQSEFFYPAPERNFTLIMNYSF
ncbi:MAG: TonB-dependent receptor [Gammaproteobacteria bacterium]|nr:TonB-dependent receptor [Gammaproteobacteria bacterium]MCW5583529.1 TonB-dependent receptor [Gammaproteobacteria bacterium]